MQLSEENTTYDCISRQAAIDAILPYCPDDDGTCSKSGDDLRNLLDDIENLPSAQPEIIRCGECTHKDKKIDYCHYLGITICERDYCSYAERRDGDG